MPKRTLRRADEQIGDLHCKVADLEKKLELAQKFEKLVKYLDDQVACLTAKLQAVQAELEEYMQADAFGWDLVHARNKAKSQRDLAADPVRMSAYQEGVVNGRMCRVSDPDTSMPTDMEWKTAFTGKNFADQDEFVRGCKDGWNASASGIVEQAETLPMKGNAS